MKRAFAAAALAMLALAAKPTLPALGTRYHELPGGTEKAAIEAACYPCHSADILVQQQLTEKQWTAEIEKMIRWGAKVDESDKAAIVTYLSRHFGAENRNFVPIRTKTIDTK